MALQCHRLRGGGGRVAVLLVLGLGGAREPARRSIVVGGGRLWLSDGTIIRLPAWMPVVLTMLVPTSWLLTRGVAHRSRRRGLCPQCGYDLRASPDRCPECGTPAK